MHEVGLAESSGKNIHANDEPDYDNQSSDYHNHAGNTH
jgi:hypothetical protein